MTTKIKKSVLTRIFWVVGSIIALWGSYFLWFFLNDNGFLGQRDFTTGWRFMTAWPVTLVGFGMIIILIATIFLARKVMINTVVGYLIGSILAMLFNTDATDPGGGATNNAWQIWTITMLTFILIGLVWEVISHRLRGSA